MIWIFFLLLFFAFLGWDGDTATEVEVLLLLDSVSPEGFFKAIPSPCSFTCVSCSFDVVAFFFSAFAFLLSDAFRFSLSCLVSAGTILTVEFMPGTKMEPQPVHALD